MIAATTAAFVAIAGIFFAVAGWAGALIAEALCANRQPFDDGPATVAVGRWPFAAIAGCVGVALAVQGASPMRLVMLAVVVLALAGGAAADLRCGILPDPFTLFPLALVVGAGAMTHDAAPAIGAAIVAVPFAAAALVTRGRGMGWGDVKLAALGGALLGAGGATVAFMLAAIAAYVIARATGGLRRALAFGPYLAASIAASLAVMRTP
jgi:prepilin signal peptidase PulO-like enzyme (type II secretory pathway)